MSKKYKVILVLIVIILFLWIAHTIWRYKRPIILLDVNKSASYAADLIFKYPPTSAKKLSDWWDMHQVDIKHRYGAPKPSESGAFSLFVWDLGDGYEPYKADVGGRFYSEDQFCFEAIKAENNCLDKDMQVGRISRNVEGKTFFSISLAPFGSTTFSRHKDWGK